MKDLTDGLPVLVKAVAVVGVPSLIALYLVYVLTGSVATASQVESVSQRVDQHVEQMEQDRDEHTRRLEVQIRLLRVMCASLAKTETTLIECSR